MRLPSFLCIGATKAATWLPPVKELHYFDHLYIPENRAWTHNMLNAGVKKIIKRHVSEAKSVDLVYVNYLCNLALGDTFTEEWYQKAFNTPRSRNKVVGEITPAYCAIPREGIEYVKKLLGDIRLIYIIRDPVDRALSQIRMSACRKYSNPKKLSEQQWHELMKTAPIISRGDYKAYIPNWVSVFGKESLLFIPFKQIKNNPRHVASLVEQHLEIPNYPGYSRLEIPAHVTRKLVIPKSLKNKLRTELTDQNIFLEDFFGPEFCSMI
jgi:hypothetical protein